jgi:hypothetical protein
VTCYTQPCKPCKVNCLLHYLPLGDESSPRGGWGICVPALPEVLTLVLRFSVQLAVHECIARDGVDYGHRHWDGVRRGLTVRCRRVDDDGVFLLEGACSGSGEVPVWKFCGSMCVWVHVHFFL